MRAVVIAGGLSSRFWPLGQGHKCALEVMGQPIMMHALHALPPKISEAVIVEPPSKPLSQLFKERGVKLSFPVEFRVQPEADGTWHAITIGAEGASGDILVMTGHHINPTVLKKLFNSQGNTFVCFEADRPEDYGIVTLKDGKISAVTEKPSKPESTLAVKSMYRMSLDFVNFMVDAGKTRSHPHLLEHAWTDWLPEHPAGYFVVKSEDLPSLKYPWHALDIMTFLLGKIKTPRISGEVAKTAVIDGPVIIEEGARILEHAVIKGPAYIGRNAVVGNHSLIRQSSVEEGALVGFGSEVVRSLVGPRAKIHHSFVGDSVLGEACNFGFGTVTGNKRLDRGHIKASVKGRRIDTKRKALGAIFGPESGTGINTSIMPGVMVGAKAFAGPGTVLNQNVPDGRTVYSKHQVVEK
ncbi:MAG TPA: hypothetical protein ENN60_03440 [archaeon]|nr:hypothetical protein [archaeon]